jgi:hypothetical protein
VKLKEKKLVDKITYKRKRRMSGHAPHKLMKMEIRKYLDKKEELEKVILCEECSGEIVCDTCGKDVFDIDSVQWRELNNGKET